MKRCNWHDKFCMAFFFFAEGRFFEKFQAAVLLPYKYHRDVPA